MANPTYTLIGSQVLGSSTASVTFSSIPQTYTNLVLRWSVRSDASSAIPFFYYVINGDLTNAYYSNTFLVGMGAGGSSGQDANKTASNEAEIQINGAGSLANTFSSAETIFPNYASSTYKVFSSFSGQENNTTYAYVNTSAFLYRNTSAITSVSVYNQSTYNFVANSSFYLFGINNS